MKKPVHVKLDEQVIEAAKAQAQRENRSLSNLVETVLRDYVAQQRREEKR